MSYRYIAIEMDMDVITFRL